jgi:CBS domain containing-hemolysin-like protein
MNFMPQVILVILLIFLNGFFVASEYALIAIRKTRVDELVKKGDSAARLIQRALDNLQNFISTTQLGSTIVSLALGWVGEPVVAGVLISLMSFLPKGPAQIIAHTLSIIISFIFLTFFTIVIGEIVPKTIAIERAELTATVTIVPMTFLVKIFKPFIRILNYLGTLSFKLIGVSPVGNSQHLYTKDEVKMILDMTRKNGILPKNEVEMLLNVFKLSDIPIRKIMMPRTDIIAFEAASSYQKLMDSIERVGYSRYPVYRKSIDNIIGFIHIKDIYGAMLKMEGRKKLSQTNLIRKIITIPETRKAYEVLLDMRRKHVHLAVVSDEFGGTAGIVTLEDIIESLVGEIQDEFDDPIREIVRQRDGSYLIDGRTSLELLSKKLHIPVKDQGYMTVSGLVLDELGREPVLGSKVYIGKGVLIVENIDGKRIKQVRYTRKATYGNHSAVSL